MKEFSKFKVFTMIFILMLIFAVAAMYSNTKDAVNEKRQKEEVPQYEQNYKQTYEPSNYKNATIKELTDRILKLEQQVSNIPDSKAANDKLNCSIQGYMSGDILVPVSEDESLQAAKENGKELVMLCSFK